MLQDGARVNRTRFGSVQRLLLVICITLAVVIHSGGLANSEGATSGPLAFMQEGPAPFLGEVPEAATITVSVEFTADSGSADFGVWLAGFSTRPDGEPDALALTLNQTSTGWFGPMWGLQLQSAAGLLPPALSPADGSDDWPGSESIALSSVLPYRGHVYEASLAYDRRTGAASVQVFDRTANRTVVTRNLQLLPHMEGPLFGVAGLAAAKEAETLRHDQPVTVLHAGVSPQVVPATPSWWIMQRSGPDEYHRSVQRIDRRRETVLSVNVPWEQPAGQLLLSLAAEDGTEVSLVTFRWGEEYVPMPVRDLPAGTYTASLRYVLGDAVWELDERQYTVGSVTVDVLDLAVSDLEAGTALLTGTVYATADGPMDGVAAGLQGWVVRHDFIWNHWSSAAGFDKNTVAEFTILEGQLIDDAGAVIPIAERISLPAADDPRALWEIRIGPDSETSRFFDSNLQFYTWFGPEPADEPWRGFLMNERAARLRLAPGVEVVSLQGRIPAGPLDMYLVIVDMTNPAVTVDALVGADLTTPASSRWPRSQPSQMVARTGAVVGINGAFFDIRDTMNPLGMLMRSGELLKTDQAGYDAAIGVTEDGRVYLGFWQWTGGVQRDDGTGYRSIAGVNVTRPALSPVLYRPPATRTPYAPAGGSVVELILDELPADEISSPDSPAVVVWRGVVTEIREGQGGTPLRQDMMVLAGAGEPGAYLRNTFSVGDVVEIPFRLVGRTEWPYLADWTELYGVVSGGTVLLRNGLYGASNVMTNRDRHPRTAVGISWDQTRLYILVVDGRSTRSVGMTYQEMADFFRYIGAFHALNLDGGGSSALAVLDPHTRTVRVLNVPSDGRQRYVPDGLGIFYEVQ